MVQEQVTPLCVFSLSPIRNRQHRRQRRVRLFPESYRASTDGAEFLYRHSSGALYLGNLGRANRARAADNTPTSCAELLCPRMPATRGDDWRTSARIHIVGYNAIFSHRSCDDALAAEINMMRYHYRERRASDGCRSSPEIYRKLYEQPIWPKNQPPMDDTETAKVFDGP